MLDADGGRVKKSIGVYLILTFALSAIFYGLIIHSGGRNAPGRYILGLMWSPGISGLLTRLFFQGNLRGHGFGWGMTRYQFASYWIPLVYGAAVYLPVWFAGFANFRSTPLLRLAERFPNLSTPALIVVFFLILATAGVLSACISTLGEELGWRGFLVPELAKVTSFGNVALASGAVWALWHYPIILFSDYHGANPRWYSCVCFTVMVMGASFLFAWMRLRSGSVWTGMLLHASHNLFIQVFFDPQTLHARVTDYWTTEFGAGLALVGIALGIIFYRKRDELPSRLDAE